MDETYRVEESFGREQLEIIVNSLSLLREEVGKTHDAATIPVIRVLLEGQYDEVTNLLALFTEHLNTYDRLVEIHGGDKDG